MSSPFLCWLDQPLPFRRRSGRIDLLPAVAITDAHEEDPVVAVETGHWVTDLAYRFLVRDLLQIALAPADDEKWLELWERPPAPDELEAALAPYRRAFVLDDPEFPAMQVRPLADDGSGEALPLCLLLPDQPTPNERDKGRAFFAHGPTVEAVGAGVVLPLLYADMVLFPSAGGGYFGVPTGVSSIKFTVGGPTLWHTLWANVLPADDDFWPEDTRFPAPCDPSVFPWTDPALRAMPLGRNDKDARRLVRAADRHAAGIPMPRRYLLDRPERDRCGLSGIEGPVFHTYRRWPAGLQYDPRGFRVVWAAEREELRRTGSGWTVGRAGPLEAKTPLRFDDWLEASLGTVREPPTEGRAARRDVRILPAPVVARAAKAAEWLEDHVQVVVEASALVLDGKVPAASAERRQPLYARSVQEELALAKRVHRLVKTVSDMGDQLANAAKSAAGGDRKGGAARLAAELRDALLVAVDADVVAYPGRVVEAAARAPQDEIAREKAIAEVESDIVRNVRQCALALFDEAFPLVTLDGATARVLASRKRLLGQLHRIVRAFAPESAP